MEQLKPYTTSKNNNKSVSNKANSGEIAIWKKELA